MKKNNSNKHKDKKSDDLNEILNIYNFMVKENLKEINWGQKKLKVQIKRSSDVQAAEKQKLSEAKSEESKTRTKEEEIIKIESPMAGTFYITPAPEDPHYVKEGDIVSPGQTVCIVEAMKVMNEIKAEIKCKIEKILVANEENVKIGQAMFLVEKV